MANANNLMSININPAAGSAGSSSGNSKSFYKTSSKGGNDFNSALDRANNTINRQAAPVQQAPTDAEEVSASDAAIKNPDAPVEQQNANTNTANQGNTNKPQDAPQNVTQNQAATANVPAEVDTKNILEDAKIEPENILPEVEIKPETEISDVPEIQNVLPFIFNANTETLLPSQVTENDGEVNLMAVMPQSNESKGQEMLNILSGKTWTAEDVQATLTAQNSQATQTAQTNQNPQIMQTAQNVEVNPEDLNLAQNGKNFTFNPNQTQNQNIENVQPQIFTRQNTLTPEQPQIQNQNQPVILNSEQSPQIQTSNLNTQETLQPTAQRQIEMQNQPILNSVNPQVEPKQNNQLNQLTDLFGANLQVENENAPLSPVQPTLNQQPEQNQQQSSNQNLQMSSQDLTAEVQNQNVGGEENFVPNVTPANNNVSTPQPVAQTQDPAATAQAARDAENVPAQIVEHARLIRSAENTEMVINLKPEHLGQLTLRVSVSQNGAVNASFYSDNAQVRAAIENSIVQLKQELSDQGLKVDNVQVSSYLSDSGLMNGQGGQAWQQQQQNHSRPVNFETLQEEVDAVTPETQTNSADGVDYKI